MVMRSPIRLLLILAATSGCSERGGGEAQDLVAWSVDVLEPPHARWAQVEEFRRDLEAARHPADGGGRAWIEHEAPTPVAVTAGGRGRWTVVYEAGELGVAEGGAIYFLPEPFWGWSNAQNTDPDAPGFLTVDATPDGLGLDTTVEGRPQAGLFRLLVTGRDLEQGEQVRWTYGAGPALARADMYAEQGARLWVSVDGDGDGVRSVLADSPSIEVSPGPAARLVVHVESVVQPGADARVTIAALDKMGNAWVDLDASVELTVEGQPLPELPASITLSSEEGACTSFVFRCPDTPGVTRLVAHGRIGELDVSARSNPLLVSGARPRVSWADFHGHSHLSDGTGTPRDFLRFARDVAGLDVVALTDHDHYGVRFMDQTPAMWEDIRDATQQFHSPGRFVTVLGYEWTSWIHGHRHVLYFDADGSGEVFSSIDPAFETPRGLWDRLRGEPAITMAHHSAGQPIPTNWTFRPDPVLEPVTEVSSVHGTSEAMDCPSVLRGAIPGNFVRDALEQGYELGFVASGDSHDGHPGLPHLNPSYGYRHARPGRAARMGLGGLTALMDCELDRQAVLETLRSRRVYATSGPRILLFFEIAPAESKGAPATLQYTVHGTADIARIEWVGRGREPQELTIDAGRLDHEGTLALPSDLASDDFVYLRVIQTDGGMAWSSPIFRR